MSQFVYVMEDQNTHLLKIGISADPEFRAEQVNRQFGSQANVIGVLAVADAARTERFIHGMLEKNRVVGEWFEATERQKNYLLAYFENPVTAKILKPVSLPKNIPRPPPVGIQGFNSGMKWPEVQNTIREKMLAQPRGYQAQLAKSLGKTPGFVNQIAGGRIPVPMEHLDAILASLGLSYDVVLRETQ